MAPSPTTPNPTRQPLKILMLHGYTQSGPLFHAKTRALLKHIQKMFPLHDITPIYPTGPLRLNPADIPGYEPSATNEDEDREAFGWWRRDDRADPPLYVGIEDGLAALARTLEKDGPVDGVVGFSQGAAMAAMVASLLETDRKDAFARAQSQDQEALPFPESFEKLSHPPLKFALCYSGFRAPGSRYTAFYEEPKIRSPVLHVLGSLDAVVDHGRSRALIDACEGRPEEDGKVVWHPGGHFLPGQRPFLDAAVRFIQEQLEGEKGKGSGEKDEEDVRDMDLPF